MYEKCVSIWVIKINTFYVGMNKQNNDKQQIGGKHKCVFNHFFVLKV